MAKKELKTNVMRVLDSKKLAYNHYTYDNSTVNGVEVARLLGQDPDRVFKTLVTRGKSGGFFVFMVPVAEELDLKKAARACGEKAVEMLPQKELLPRTGFFISFRKGYVLHTQKFAFFSNNLLSVRCRRIAFDRVFAYNKGAKYYFCWRSRI